MDENNVNASFKGKIGNVQLHMHRVTWPDL